MLSEARLKLRPKQARPYGMAERQKPQKVWRGLSCRIASQNHVDGTESGGNLPFRFRSDYVAPLVRKPHLRLSLAEPNLFLALWEQVFFLFNSLHARCGKMYAVLA